MDNNGNGTRSESVSAVVAASVIVLILLGFGFGGVYMYRLEAALEKDTLEQRISTATEMSLGQKYKIIEKTNSTDLVLENQESKERLYHKICLSQRNDPEYQPPILVVGDVVSFSFNETQRKNLHLNYACYLDTHVQR